MNQLQTIQLQGKMPGAHLLITGGVHGDEFEPMVAIRQLAQQLKKTDFSGCVTLVPVVNEAAFQRGSRAAEDGLDLARTCPGDENGSLTQQLAYQLSKLIHQADFYIDLHTGGTTMSIFPLAGYMLHVDLAIRKQQQEMARAFNFPMVWGSDASLNGRSLSVARDANIPAIYVEYHGAAICESQGIDTMLAGCLNVMRHLKMLDRKQPASKVIYDIEETHPESGFFQQSHLSPSCGFFEAAVSLGQTISKGETLGWIVDCLGEDRVEIMAETTGVINCLRTFPSVKTGDCLGYVVEFEMSEQ